MNGSLNLNHTDMKLTINFPQFCDQWNRWDDRKNTFSYNGKRALFDHLEEYEENTGEDIELDIVALCCDFTEYDSVLEAAREYDESIKDEKEARAYLEDRTTVIDVTGGGVIIQNF